MRKKKKKQKERGRDGRFFSKRKDLSIIIAEGRKTGKLLQSITPSFSLFLLHHIVQQRTMHVPIRAANLPCGSRSRLRGSINSPSPTPTADGPVASSGPFDWASSGGGVGNAVDSFAACACACVDFSADDLIFPGEPPPTPAAALVPPVVVA